MQRGHDHRHVASATTAPWYRGVGPLTMKADVYSYGVVLLEIVTCRRSMELEEAGEERTLMECARGEKQKLASATRWLTK